MKKSSRYTRTTQQRFDEKWRKDEATGCHEWTAARDSRGYGQMRVERVLIQAHRLAWILRRGDIAGGTCVLHKCDNPGCVNAEHLFLGTHADNMRDMMRKGRNVGPPHGCGEGSPSARLTDLAVDTIRAEHANGAPIRELADRWGCTPGYVRDLVTRRRGVRVTSADEVCAAWPCAPAPDMPACAGGGQGAPA